MNLELEPQLHLVAYPTLVNNVVVTVNNLSEWEKSEKCAIKCF